MKWTHRTALFLLGIITMPCLAHSPENTTQLISTGRYIGYRETPDAPGLIDPLQGSMHEILSSSQTIGSAMGDVLIGTGYIMAIESASDPEVQSLYRASLPLLQRDLNHHSVLDALRILAGKPWQFVIDPVHRMISFELPYPYQKDAPSPSRYQSYHSGLVLLGFEEPTTDEAPKAHSKNILSNDCQFITRDLTKMWETRKYWCYPFVSTTYIPSAE
ncbi:MAG: hypothetical protein KZQ82_20665 [Candidatus Thiodiazotropha sp. (ex Lucinoma annulata)]|nr:hypothetical protein [Candidatus Thiodiazotropha sp. (ex Lucinoma annulata)]